MHAEQERRRDRQPDEDRPRCAPDVVNVVRDAIQREREAKLEEPDRSHREHDPIGRLGDEPLDIEARHTKNDRDDGEDERYVDDLSGDALDAARARAIAVVRRDGRGDRDDRDQVHELRKQHLQGQARRSEHRVDHRIAERDRVREAAAQRERALLAAVTRGGPRVEQANPEHGVGGDDHGSETEQRRRIGGHHGVRVEDDDRRQEMEVSVEDPLVPRRSRDRRAPLPGKTDRERSTPE